MNNKSLNRLVIKNSLQLLVNKMNSQIYDGVIKLAEDIVLMLETADIPVVTHNLKDAVGVGVFKGTVIQKYIPTKQAKVPRQASGDESDRIYPKGITNRENIWGNDELKNAINRFSMESGVDDNTWWLVIFSSMPYAIVVDTAYLDDALPEMFADGNKLARSLLKIKI